MSQIAVTHSQDYNQQNVVIYDTTVESLTYPELIKHLKHSAIWNTSCANELGRLTQGVGNRVAGTNTAFLISHNNISKDRLKDITYANFVVDYKPNKTEPRRTRMTAGGGKINYPDDVSTPTGDMITTKIILNSTVSTPNAKLKTIGDKNFYLFKWKLCEVGMGV